VSNNLIPALKSNHHILAALQGVKKKKEKEKGKTT
jgi:zona occludens toxin (predicted ATPase)